VAVLLDINKFERLYRRTVKRVAVTGTTEYLKLSPVGPGKIRVLTHVTVENQTTDLDQCRIGIDHGGVLHYLDELKNVVADELMVSRSDVLLGEGDRFFAELIGTITDATLIMICVGWEQRMK